MTRWIKALAVALAAVVGLVPAFAQLSYAQAVLAQQAPITLPQGDELSDAELLEVDGEAHPLVERLVWGGLVGAVTGGFDLAIQKTELERGERQSINWPRVALMVGAGLTVGALSPGQDAARVAERVTQAVQKVQQGLHVAHVALHTHVREPVVNAVKTAWDWIWGRR